MTIDDEYKQRKTNRGYVWLKLFTDTVDDPEFMRLSDTSKAVYFEVYMLAGKSDASGLVLAGDKPATIDGLAWSLRRNAGELQTTISELEQAGFLNVDEKCGHVTVCRFASEQGPSMADKRAQWAKDQRLSRARAKGEIALDDQEKEKEKDQEKEKEKDQEKEKIKTQTQTKTKRVSPTSGKSQDGVSPDINFNERERAFKGLFDGTLALWNEIKGREYKPSSAYHEMIKNWVEKGVKLEHVRKELEQVKAIADTPIYLKQMAIRTTEKDPVNLQEKNVNNFREAYRKQKAQGANE